MAKSVTIRLAELTKPLTVKKVKEGTTLSDFLEDNGLEYSSSVRVNAEATKKGYALKNGDIITVVGAVSGGLV